MQTQSTGTNSRELRDADVKVDSSYHRCDSIGDALDFMLLGPEDKVGVGILQTNDEGMVRRDG